MDFVFTSKERSQIYNLSCYEMCSTVFDSIDVQQRKEPIALSIDGWCVNPRLPATRPNPI